MASDELPGGTQVPPGAGSVPRETRDGTQTGTVISSTYSPPAKRSTAYTT